MKKLFRKLFLVKEIVSKKGELHFQRWRIISCKWLAIYIHKIYKEDNDKHLHNHPWNYWNMILSGGYGEASMLYNQVVYHNMLPFSSSIRKHDRYHKISTIFKPTTTLFITSGRKYDWGYDVDGEFIDHDTYRKNKNLGLYD
jgi:hypothetical protein